MMQLIIAYYEKAAAALEEGADINKLIDLPVREQIGRFKYTEPDKVKEVFGQVTAQLDKELYEAKQAKEEF